MLDQLRQGAQGWVSKILMILLVLSFAVWGIGGFEGYGTGTLARVGDVEVGVNDFARAYDRTSRAAQLSGRQVSPDQVLSQLLHAAALDDAAAEGNLGVSDDRIAEEIAKDTAFQTGGTFDRERFAAILANAGINHDDYVRDVRRDLVRRQVASTLGAGLAVPQPLVEALYQLQHEERTVSYVVVDETAIEPVGEPDQTSLERYFEENKSKFRAPEYRKLALLTLDPAAIADPAAVLPEEVAAEYERRKATLTRPERRRFEQIRFADAAAAEAALREVQAGGDFAALADAQGLSAADIDQGLKTRAEILDPAVAEVVFTAAQNVAVAAIEGAVEPSLIRVTEVQPGSVTSLQEAEPKIRQDLAARAAAEEVNAVYDQVEDARAGGATLEEVARTTSLPYRVVEAVSADLKAPDGTAVSDIPSGGDVVREAFESDVGVENSPVRAGNSYVFYEVLDIEAERDRTLEEVRADVTADWKTAETARRVAERADALLEKLRTGVPLIEIGAEIGKPVETIEKVTRGAPAEGLTPNASAQAFAGPEGHVANAEGTGTSRILLKVDSVTVPIFFAEAADSKTMTAELSQSLQSDLLTTYNQQLLQDRETTINNAAYQQLSGQIQSQ